MSSGVPLHLLRVMLLFTSFMMLVPGYLAAPQPGQRHQDYIGQVILGQQQRPQEEYDLLPTPPFAPQLLNGQLNQSQLNGDVIYRHKRQDIDLNFGDIDMDPNILLLFFYAQRGNLTMVQTIVEDSKVPVDAADDRGWTATMWASQRGHTEVVIYLVEEGAFVNHQNKNNWTSLMFAARFGHTDIVHYLLEKDATVDHQNEHGDTALLWSTGAGHDDIVELLLIHEADPNLQENVNGFTPVSVAAAMNRETIIRMMDKYSWIDLDHMDFKNRTPVNLAAMTGQATMVLLLGYHGNINIPETEYGMTCAHWGVNLRDTSTLRATLLLCPDLTIRDNRGNTPMMIAQIVGNQEGINIITDHLAAGDKGCWIGDDEYPAKEFIFFDCKQMQCMCRGYWRQTGIIDPDCVAAHVNVVAAQELESSSHNATEMPHDEQEEHDHHHHD